jgi:hypothetical protein
MNTQKLIDARKYIRDCEQELLNIHFMWVDEERRLLSDNSTENNEMISIAYDKGLEDRQWGETPVLKSDNVSIMAITPEYISGYFSDSSSQYGKNYHESIEFNFPTEVFEGGREVIARLVEQKYQEIKAQIEADKELTRVRDQQFAEQKAVRDLADYERLKKIYG